MIEYDRAQSATIPSGYRIIVSSWENDGDNHMTRSVSGIQSAEEVRLYVELLWLLESLNQVSGCFGNMYSPNEGERAAFGDALMGVFQKHPEGLLLSGYSIPDDAEEAVDLGMEILGEFTGYGDFFTRVVESVTIYHIPETIVMNDVTSEYPAP